MSTTPRTDAEEAEAFIGASTIDSSDVQKAYDFARQLERELEEARLKAADRHEWQDVAIKVSKQRDSLQSQLTSAKSALVKAREALNAQKDTMHSMGFDCLSVETALTAINEVLK